MTTRVLLVAGARPNYMKIAPIYWAVERGHAQGLELELVHTGQHYDETMSGSFFRDLHLPEPSVNLKAGSASHSEQTAKVMVGFETVLRERRPDVVVVVGDVNSTVACALATAKMLYDHPGGDAEVGTRRGSDRPLLVHVEAGLRSRDRTMPEEINRVVTDAISDALFTTCRDADRNLAAEGVPHERIFFVGNPMIDSLRRCLGEAEHAAFLRDVGLEGRPFGLCTLHRPSNVDSPTALERILDALGEIAADIPVLLPLHPRTRQRIERFGLQERLATLTLPSRRAPHRGLLAIEPISYLEMLQAQKAARFVLTDSGGIQEETTALGVPCVTLRENTERPITIVEGTNVLAGTTRNGIIDGLAEAERKASRARVPELWDGRAGERIADVLQSLREHA